MKVKGHLADLLHIAVGRRVSFLFLSLTRLAAGGETCGAGFYVLLIGETFL